MLIIDHAAMGVWVRRSTESACHSDQGLNAGVLTQREVLLAAETAVGDQTFHVTQYYLGLRLKRRQHQINLRFVVGGLRHADRNHPHRRRIHPDLGVVRWFKTATGYRHEARFFIGQIDLIIVPCSGLGGFERLASQFLANRS